MVTDEPLGLILRAIALDPCDPFLRRACADGAEELGDGPVAKLQRWVADVLDGNHRFHVVIRRRGAVVPPGGQAPNLRTQDRNYWVGVAARLFKEHPDAALVVVDRRPMTTCGLRAQGPAPRARRSGRFRRSCSTAGTGSRGAARRTG